jgi:hypothetical protein
LRVTTFPLPVNVGLGTLTTNELVAGFVTLTKPACVILVLGVLNGTVGDVMVRLGYVPVMDEGPTLVKLGLGTLSTNEFVAGFATLAIPVAVILALLAPEFKV